MKTFTRWFIIMAFVFTGGIFAEQYNTLSIIFKNDVSYISLLICVMFIVGSMIIGYMSWMVDKNVLIDVKKLIQIPTLIADNLTSLGLLGTIVGFCLMMYMSFNETDVDKIIGNLKKGVSVALYTTLTGLIGSIILELELFVFNYLTFFRNDFK